MSAGRLMTAMSELNHQYLRILRHHEEALPVRNADKPQAAFELVDSEVFGVFKLKRPRRLPAAAQIGVVEVGRGA